jgi:hypothetical protein
METTCFTLNGKVDVAEIPQGAQIRQFRNAVKEHRKNELRHVDAVSVQVFAAGVQLGPADFVPTPTT